MSDVEIFSGYCKDHGAKSNEICRASEDIAGLKSADEKMRKIMEEKIDAFDNANSLTHGKIFETIRELDNSKLNFKTFALVVTVFAGMVLLAVGAPFTYQNIQINKMAKTLDAATIRNSRAMKASSDTISRKLDDVSSGMSKLAISMVEVKSDMRHMKQDLDTYRQRNQHEHEAFKNALVPKAWGGEFGKSIEK